MINRTVSNMKLNLDDLKESRKRLSDSINVTRSQAFDARDHQRISSSEFQNAQHKWGKLQIQESKLAGLIMSLELNFLLDTNINSPMSKIIQATDKLKAAATNIQDLQQFLGSIADVIQIFDNLIKAIENGLIANIP